MATLNFDESIVLILFAQGIGTNPTQADIISFDAQLQTIFGPKLHEVMTQEGLEIDVHSRSLVLGCRPHVGGTTPPAQIRNACRFVLKAKQALSASPLAAGMMVSAKRVSPAALGAKTRTAGSRSAGRRTRESSRSAKRSRRGPS